MTHSSCKRDTKSKSHVGMKLALVRLFSCKHPLRDKRFANVDPASKLLKKTERSRCLIASNGNAFSGE